MNSPIPFDQSGTYKTDCKKHKRLQGVLPSLFFYTRLLSVIFKGSKIAKRGLYDRVAWENSSLKILNALEQVGIQFEITGINNFKDLAGPCIFVGNHMSALETAVLPVIIDPIKPVTFIVKESLINYPVFKHIMRATKPIAVTRTNPREDLKTVMKEGAEKIKEGISIIAFPQTTRTTTFDPSEFNTIGVKLAKHTGTPIIPFALKTDAWANGRIIKDFGRLDHTKMVYFAFGGPIHVKDRGTEEHQAIIAFIQDRLKEWGGT
jgi:1-acyl-sn-glycerol-3-phosphate acyltransferase